MNKKVLIVDDEPSIVLSLDFLMKKNGFEVFIARDGEEALQIARREKPRVMVLDVMMPKVDGYEVCAYLKASPELAATRVIFLSAKSKEEDIRRGYDVGADLYLTKPFSTRSLMKQVQELAQ